ncbi:hypothetical protein MTO96_028435 [Rhipicephalus appendiculatus]
MAAQKTPSYVGCVRLIFEAGTKLEAKPQTVATAATYFHRFFQECSQDDYDFYLVAATAMYLAGKVEEDYLKIRDVVNVFHKSAYPKSDPLPLAEEYWCLRDSIVQCELLMLRVLQFRVSVDHPHRYLLHYLRSLNDWLGPLTCGGGGGARSGPPCQIPLAQVAWSLLCDMYLQPTCLRYPPSGIGGGCPPGGSACLRRASAARRGQCAQLVRDVLRKLVSGEACRPRHGRHTGL